MIEEWRPVVGYEGLYEVSSYGRVKSLCKYDSRNRFRDERILKLCADRLGYLKVGLCSNDKKKKYLVHRLVAQAFIPNPNNLPQVNHRDENPSNDNVDNLEWCDAKYNSNYGTRNDRIRTTRLRNGTSTGLSREEYSKKWYQEHKNEHNEKQREYYQKNKDRICEQKKEYRRKKKEEIQNNL